MPKRYRDANNVSHYVSVGSIPKFPPRPRQKDFETIPTPEDQFHKNLIRVDGEMPFAVGKGAEVGGMVTAENIPTRFMRAPILARASSQKFSAPEFAGLIRVS